MQILLNKKISFKALSDYGFELVEDSFMKNHYRYFCEDGTRISIFFNEKRLEVDMYKLSACCIKKLIDMYLDKVIVFLED